MENRILFLLFFSVFTFFLCNSQEIILYTPNGTQIYAIQHDELDPSDIAFIHERIAEDYPNATILSDASYTYNCHSYAWNMKEGGPICWINGCMDEICSIINIQHYWLDGSYKETITSDKKIIYYYLGDHSAIPSSTHQGMYESKWGVAPLMRHAPEYGPTSYNMQFRHYYKNTDCNTYISYQTYDSTGVTVQMKGFVIEISNTVFNHGTIIDAHARDHIFLNQGFIANAGSYFKASIDPLTLCGGMIPRSIIFIEEELEEDTNNESNIDNLTVSIAIPKNTIIQNSKITIIPNPNTGTFQLETNFPLSDIAHLKITNMLGGIVYETKNLTTNTIQLQNTTNGLYFVAVILKDGTMLTQKMMEQR